MRKIESINRLVALQMTTLGLLIQIAGYGFIWFKFYEDAIKLVFWSRGDFLVIGIYGVLLLFFTATYGGTKTGYLKPLEVFLSQVFSLLMVNVITYAQVSLMCEWFANPKPMLLLTAAQLVFAFAWTFISDGFYKMVFPPRELLLVHANRSVDRIKMKFASRGDRYQIVGSIDIADGVEAVEKEIMLRYGGVILWDIPIEERNRLLKFCYSQSIRVYMMPKISDVIIMGSERMHLFDTPICLTREYALTIEQRIAKRCIDLVCALLLLLITWPIMLITAIAIKLYDRGPVLYSQVRCTTGNKEFKILKFRSMRVNAETDTIYPNYYIPHISEQRNFDLFKGIYRKPISYMLIIMNWKFFDYFICSNPKMKPFIKWLKTRSKDYKALVLAIHAPKANAWQQESVS